MRGDAQGARVELDGAEVDAIVRAGGRVLRTAAPDRVVAGFAQVCREAAGPELALRHRVFAPARSRPIFLARVELVSRTDSPLLVDYTEIWRVLGVDYAAVESASVCRTTLGQRALAEASAALRARVPMPVPTDALALELRVLMPPRARRELGFVYALPDLDEEPAPLVRAWRGDVERELLRTVLHWRRELGEGSGALDAYRRG